MAIRDSGGISAGDIAKVASAQGSISLDISGDVKQSMLDFISVANRMVSGSKLGQYFDTTEHLAKRLANAVRLCNEDFKQFRGFDSANAKEVVNTFNALTASANGADVSSFFKGIEGGFRGVMSTVEAVQAKIGKFTEGFSEADFSRMFGSFQQIKDWADTLGLSTKEVENLMVSLSRLSGTDVSALTQQLANAQREITSLKEQLNSAKSGRMFKELQAEIDNLQSSLRRSESMLEELRTKATIEFRDFLSVNMIDPDQTDEWGLTRFQDYFNSIQQGTMTAREAITRFKTEYESLFQNMDSERGLFNVAQVEEFTAKLEQIFVRVEEIGTYIQNTTANAPGLLTNAVERDLQNINKEEQALRHVIDEGGQLGQVGQIVNGVAEASANGTQKMSEMSEQTVKLVDSLTALGSAGEESLTAISAIFRNIGTIKDLDVNTDQFKKLKEALEILQGTTGLEKIGLLSNVNLQGFSNLKISTTIGHLATYLPPLSRDVDIGKLQALSQINLSNFSQDNLKVSKASMDHLRELIAQISGKPTQIVNNGQTQQLTEEQTAVERLNTTYREHSEAVAHAIADEQRKSIVSTELTAKLQSEKEAMDAVSGSAERGASSGQKYSAVWDKMFLGKFVAEFAKVKAQFDALEDKPAKLADNMRKLEAAENDMRAATNMKDRIDAYERFVTILDVVRTQIGAVSAEAKNSNADFKSLLNLVKQANPAMEGIANSSFTSKLREMSAKMKDVADPTAITRLKEMRQAYVDMQSAYGTSGPNTEQDYQALIQAQIRWRNALEGLNRALAANRAESAAANQANRESAQTAKAIADGAAAAEKQIKNLNAVFESLRDKTKFDTSSFEQMRTLLEQVNNTSLSNDQRQSALQQLNDLIKQSTENLRELSAAEKAEAAAKKKTDDAAKQKATLIKQLNSLLDQCTKAEQRYAIVARMAFAKDSYKGIQDTKASVQQLLQQLNGVDPKFAEIAAGVRNAQTAFSNFNTSLKTSGGLLGNYLTTGMSQLKSRLTYSLGLAAMVYKAVGEVKKMVTTAIELDSAMNELQIVTRSSGEELAAYGTRVSAMAKETAQATKDLIDATTVYARLGYSMDESAVLSKYTAMLQGVGDIEAGAAQDAMTAILKAFNVNIDEVESVMDKLVVVGNNFPISVSQLAEGMNNAGSMLAVAGNTFEESIALLTASNATVQNISKASTGLRTIAARIRKMKTEDGEIVEESKYNAMIDALTRHNVALVDANGEYRKTYDIIKDIAGVWGQMTSMQKSAVVEALAGTRQQNIFASLMTQFDDAEKAMKRMETAAGELQDSYDIYLGSIKAHTQQLKAAFDELSVKVVNSDFVKGVVDFVRKLVEGLSKLVDSVGTLGIALSALGSLAIIKFISGGGWVGFVLSLTKAVLAIASVAPHLLALAGLFGSLILLVKAWRQAHPSMDTLVKEADAAQKKVDELNKTLESNKQRIEELNKLKTDGSITESQEKELAILKQQTEELKAQLHVTKALADTAHANVINKVHGDVNTFFNAPTQGRYLGEGAGEGAIYEQADPAAEKLRRDLERYKELQKDLDHVNTKIGFANREYEDAVAFAEEMQAEVAQKNVDLSRTVFGNIDTENRLRLEWTKDTVKQYKDILQGYLRDGEDVEDWIGSYSTVLGQWKNFDVDGKSIPIAFSPILQTMNGPVLLDDKTVSNYINDVIHEAERRGDTSAESLLKIDASGLFEHDGTMLWGLIADIGDEAERVSEIMHYVGTDGALIDATQTEAQTLQNINSILQQKKDLEAEIAQLSGSTAEQEQQLLEWREQLLNEDDSESIELLSQLEDMLDDIQKVTKKDTYEIEKFKRNLDYLDSTVRNKLAKGLDLAGDEIKEFDNWMSRCGYDMDSFNKMLAQLGSNAGDIGFEGDEENKSALEMHISQWGTLTEEIQKATAAMEEYEDKMKGLKGGTLAERLQKGWADTMDEISQGRANSDAAWAFYELLFSDEQIDAAGRNVERLAQMVASYKAIFDDDNTENGFKDDDSPYGLGQRLIHFLEDNAASYQNIRFDRDANGLTYVIADFKALAEEMGWADEAFTMLIQDAQAYSDTLIIDTTQYNKLVDGLNAFTEGIDPSNINEAKDALQKFMEVAIQEEDYVGDRDFLRMLDMLNGDGYIQLDPSYYREILDQAKNAVEEAKALAAEEAAGEESNPVINMDIDEEQVLNDTETLLNNIQAYLNDNPRYITYLPNEYDYESGGSGGESKSSGDTSVDKPSSAIGKKPGKNGGDTLVNELGPELISDNGRAFIANGGKPGFVRLSDNAIVFTANETKDILKGKRNVNAKAYATGTVRRGNLINRLVRGSVQARAYIRCPVCGTANPDSRSTCYSCGASLYGGSVATVNNSIGTTGNANAGVNRSAYGSPTAMPYQNMGGTGYDIYGYDSYDQQAYEAYVQAQYYMEEQRLLLEAARKREEEARRKAAIAEHKNRLNETKRNTGSNKNKFSGTGGGNYVGGSDYQSYGDPQKVDWVAVRINRLQRTIADLEKVASSGFKKLDTRLQAARDQIAKTTDEIEVMERAYDRYIQEANSVGLSESIAANVREGTIDISSYDDDTRKKIDEYTEW